MVNHPHEDQKTHSNALQSPMIPEFEIRSDSESENRNKRNGLKGEEERHQRAKEEVIPGPFLRRAFKADCNSRWYEPVRTNILNPNLNSLPFLAINQSIPIHLAPTNPILTNGEEPPSGEAASEMGRFDPSYSSKLDSEEGETQATTSSFTMIWLG